MFLVKGVSANEEEGSCSRLISGNAEVNVDGVGQSVTHNLNLLLP